MLIINHFADLVPPADAMLEAVEVSDEETESVVSGSTLTPPPVSPSKEKDAEVWAAREKEQRRITEAIKNGNPWPFPKKKPESECTKEELRQRREASCLRLFGSTRRK